MLSILKRFSAALLLACCVQVLLVGQNMAQDRAEEYQLKAVLMNRLMSFVTWPRFEPSQSLTLCLTGEDPFGGNLQSAFNDSNVAIRQIRRDYSQLDSCNVLFISDSEIPNVDSVLAQVKGKPILTVSDVPRFASSGGMIYLTFENRRVRFRINKAEADAAQVRLSFQLLSLADIVATNSRGR